MPSGIGMIVAASATSSSAYPPQPTIAITRSPTRAFVTPAPTSTISPATSPPGVNGNGGLNWYLF